MEKPLLLVDVDGVLNRYPLLGFPTPEGHEVHQVTFWNGEKYKIILRPQDGPDLLSLTDMVDLVWATGWRHEANTEIAPRIGLPQLPVIDYHPRFSESWFHAKRHAVREHIGDRAVFWIDDDFEEEDLLWSQERARKVNPTLCLKTDPREGLTQLQIDTVREIAEGLRDA
jgi:hypothetical protein